MKTKNLAEVQGVKFTGGTSFRVVLKNDGVGFAMMQTVIDKGGPYLWHYKNHQEACMCIAGNGQVKDLTTGEVHQISSGVTYIVDAHQPHEFTAFTQVVLVSVFNPPLRGDESHDKEGNYQ